MLAFRFERLAIVQVDDFALGLDGGRDAILPFDFVRVQEQFVFCRVVEYRHRLRSNDDKPLLFDWVQPTDENVRLHAARKIEVAQRDVADTVIEIGAALARDTRRHLVQERQHHGDVVRSKAPQDVLLGPYLSDVETIGIQVVDLSKCAAPNQFLQLQDGRVIPENVPDHENSAVRLGQCHEMLAMLHINGERLLDKHVFSRFESRLRHLIVGHRRRG